MEKLNNISDLGLIIKYAFRDLVRNYKKIFSIILTLFISLFILSAILTIEESLKKELNDNAKALLGGDLEIDYNRDKGNLELVNEVKEFTTISQMIEFSTMISTNRDQDNQSLFTRIKTVDEQYPLYGEVVHEPIGSLDRIHNEKNTILVNENIFKTMNLKIDEQIKVQDQLFKVVGVIKSVPDVSGFVASKTQKIQVILSVWIYGKAIWNHSMINNDEYRPFHEPWHAQIFALTIHLNEQGHFEWKDWSQAFSEALSLKSSNGAIVEDEDYYLVWLKTIEEFLAQNGKLKSDELTSYFDAWRAAFLSTPHGQPVKLKNLSAG